MSDSAQGQRHPVYVRDGGDAGDSHLGWILLFEERKGARWVSGKLEPGPDYEQYRELVEEIVHLEKLLDEPPGTLSPDEKEKLEQRQDELLSQFSQLELTVGEPRFLVDEFYLNGDMILNLIPPKGSFELTIKSRPDDRIWDLSPLPSYLTEWTEPPKVQGDWVTAMVRCPCGSQRLEFHYPGVTHEVRGEIIPCTMEMDGVWFFLVKAVCSECRREHVLFDSHYHGHDGFLFENKKERALPRPPLVPWQCSECQSIVHHGKITIISDYKDRYFEYGYAENFGPESWPDAFGCFAMEITCCECGYPTPCWVDYEAR